MNKYLLKLQIIFKNIYSKFYSKIIIVLKNKFNKFNFKKAFLFFCVLLLFISLIWVFIYSSSKIHVFTQGDLVIIQTPAPAYVYSLRNSTTQIDVFTEIKAFRFCDVICSFNFESYNKSISFRGELNYNHSIILNSPIVGSGIIRQKFTTTCKTISSFVCKETEPIQKITNVILEFDLTSNEKEIIKNKSIYDDFITKTIVFRNLLKPTGLVSFDVQIRNLNYTLDLYDNLSKEIINNWEEYKFYNVPSIISFNPILDYFENMNLELNSYLAKEKQLEKNFQFLDLEILQIFINQSLNYKKPNYVNIKNSISVFELIEKNYTIVNRTDVIKNIDLLINETQFSINKTIFEYELYLNAFENIFNVVKLYESIEENNSLGNISFEISSFEFICSKYIYYGHKYNLTLDFEDYCDKLDNSAYLIPTYRFKAINVSFPNIENIKKYFNTSIELSNETFEFVSDKKVFLSNYSDCGITCPIGGDVVLFIHGHAFAEKASPYFSLNSFNKIKMMLESNLNISDCGSVRIGDLLEIPNDSFYPKLSVSGTYYQISYNEIIGYSYSTQKAERIENYALRLNELIEQIRRTTGQKKITVVTHSMGGLVAREYQRIFRDKDIVLITINSPNQGISGKINSLCSIFGGKNECLDMEENSVFLKRLNAYRPSLDFPIYVIRSTGCDMSGEMGDGIVTDKNAMLPFTPKGEYIINGTCGDNFNYLHNSVLDSSMYPEIINILSEIISQN